MAKKKTGAEEPEIEPGIQPGHSVRGDDGTVYKAGDEDALAEAMTSDQAKALEEKGVIHGVTGKAKAAPKAEK